MFISSLEKKHPILHFFFPPQANASVPADSFLLELTRIQMSDQLPAMTEAVRCIRARGLKTAVLTNNFYLENGESFLPIDRKQFDVVSSSCSTETPVPRGYYFIAIVIV